jgi:hypothetical protein
MSSAFTPEQSALLDRLGIGPDAKANGRTALPVGHKRCPRCETTKPLDEFPRHRGRGDGHGSRCKRCASADTALYAAARGRALIRLSQAHKAEYDALYTEEKAKLTGER